MPRYQENLSNAGAAAPNAGNFGFLDNSGSAVVDPGTVYKIICAFTDRTAALAALQASGFGILRMRASTPADILAEWEVYAGPEQGSPVAMLISSCVLDTGDIDPPSSTYNFELIVPGYPANSTVSNGVTYGLAGEFTGNLTVPAAANTLIDAAPYGENASVSGTYTSPVVGDVRSSVTYGPSLALTGTLALPTESHVETGVGFGQNGTEYTGTLDPGNGTTVLIKRTSMIEINLSNIKLSPPPLTLPSSTTSLTALCTANGYTFPTGTTRLTLQAQDGYMKLDPPNQNSTQNASQNGTILESNQTCRFLCNPNEAINLGNVQVIRGDTGSKVKVICE